MKNSNLIFGSTAIKYWYPDFPREPEDIDVLVDKPNNKEFYYHESEIIDNILHEYYCSPSTDMIRIMNIDKQYVDPDILYTIKVSHSFWYINWDKTIFDIMFLKDKGCKLNLRLFRLLYKDWELIHGKKHVNMNKPCDEFFTERVTRKYDHDYLHEYFKFRKVPYHTRIRPNLDNAWCSEDLFNNLTHTEKIECALEEIYVIAVERYGLNGIPPKTAKYKAIKAVVTHITKGWFPLFIIENLKEILEYDDAEYYKKFKELKEIK